MTGHKSELMTSPASRMTWRGFIVISFLFPQRIPHHHGVVAVAIELLPRLRQQTSPASSPSKKEAFGKTRTKQQTQWRLTSSAVMALGDVRSIRQI